MKQFFRRNKSGISILFIIFIICTAYHWKKIHQFPANIHSWAQSDRYALAMGFINNKFDLFHPQTYVYNHQFPHNFQVANNTTITSVDFPIHEYFVAILMKILNSRSPAIFNIYILLYSIVGLFFLFQTSILINRNYWYSVFIVLFVLTSPVYLYYHAGFLPSIPAFSNLLISLYFYVQFIHQKRMKYFFLFIFFITLAALTRTTFSIFIITAISIDILQFHYHKKIYPFKLTGYFVSIALIGGYYLYNLSLKNEHGSMFLNYLIPPYDYQNAISLLKWAYQNFFYHYLTVYHYIFVACLVLGVTIHIIFFHKGFTRVGKQLLLFTLSSFIGCVIFLFSMLQQIKDHDYYFLDTLFIVIVLLTLVSISMFDFNKKLYRIISIVILMIFITGFCIESNKKQFERNNYSYRNKTKEIVEDFYKAEKFLDSIGIPKDAKLMVIDGFGPNIPFIQMNRSGYAVTYLEKNNIKSKLDWDFDYIVLQDIAILTSIWEVYPELLKKLHRIAGNKKISIYKLTTKIHTVSKKKLISEIEQQYEKVQIHRIDFESNKNKLWKRVNKTDSLFYEGGYSGYTAGNSEYGLEYSNANMDFLTKAKSIVKIESKIFTENINLDSVYINLNVWDKKRVVLLDFKNIKKCIHEDNTWISLTCYFSIPILKTKENIVNIFFRNMSNVNVYYDNVKISFLLRN